MTRELNSGVAEIATVAGNVERPFIGGHLPRRDERVTARPAPEGGHRRLCARASVEMTDRIKLTTSTNDGLREARLREAASLATVWRYSSKPELKQAQGWQRRCAKGG